MKAITIRAPHSNCIMAGIKKTENRKWKRKNFKKQIVVVHQSLKPDTDAITSDGEISRGRKTACPTYGDPCKSTAGKILGLAVFEECLPLGEVKSPTIWHDGPYCFEISRVYPFPENMQLNCKGALGFWKLPPDVDKEVCKFMGTHGIKL